MPRRYGKLLFKVSIFGMEFQYRMVTRARLMQLWGNDGVEIQGMLDRDNHIVYVADDLGNELPVIILHESKHLAMAAPQGNDQICAILKCIPEDRDQIEEALISYLSPTELAILKQIPRKFLS